MTNKENNNQKRDTTFTAYHDNVSFSTGEGSLAELCLKSRK